MEAEKENGWSVLRSACKLVLQSLRSRKVMEDWSRKLRRSGYPATMRHEVIKAALDRYKKMCMEEDEGVRPIHRPRSWKVKERRREKELKRTNWHQS